MSAEEAPQQTQEVQESIQNMTFANNLAVLPQEPPSENILTMSGTRQFTDDMVHSIISFLERPQLLQSFLWNPSSGNLVGSDLLFWNPRDTTKSQPGVLIPSQLFHTMQLRKLDGFAGFRATAVIKLQINNQPFNCGRLLMAAVPMPKLLRDRGSYIQETITNIQNINHVQMDIAKQTEVELRIPFISPYNCYDLSTGNFDWAQLFIKVYGPLNSLQEEKLECIVWYHFEDIQLGFPTSVQLEKYNMSIPVQQSGKYIGNIDTYPVQGILLWSGNGSQDSSGICNLNIPAAYLKKQLWIQIYGYNSVKAFPTFTNLNIAIVFPPMYNGLIVNGPLMINGSPVAVGVPSGQYINFSINIFSIQNVPINMQPFRVVIDGNTDEKKPLNVSLNPAISNPMPVQINNSLKPIDVNLVSPNPLPVNVGNSININDMPPVKVDLSNVSLTMAPDVNIKSINPDILPLWTTNAGPAEQDYFETTEEVNEDVNQQFDFEVGENVLVRQQSGKVSRRVNAPKPRMPPKEASAAQVNENRAEESNGAFATVVNSVASKISNTVSYFGKAIGSIGNIFGWSKPQLSHAGDTVVIRPMQYFQNTEGIDHSHVLSLSIMNNIDNFDSLVGTDLDEMDFEFLKRIPQFFTYFNYTDDSFVSTGWQDGVFYGEAGEILAQWFVAPTYSQPWQFDINASLQGGIAQVEKFQDMPTTLSYICSPFVYWTGSLVYTFRFVKTDYHSGRIEFSYHPFANHFINKNNSYFLDKEQFDRFDYCYRVVVDLRENSEVSISVPYVSPQPWKVLEMDKTKFDPLFDTVNFDAYPPTKYVNETNYQNYCSGVFVVRKLTPLIRSSAVIARGICCLVEVRAGDDFRVSCPATSGFTPFSFPRGDPVVGVYPTQQSGVFATPGTLDTRSTALEGIIPPSITGNNSDIQREDMQMFTAGEIFRNFRPFTRRFNFSYVITPLTNTYYTYYRSVVNNTAQNKPALLSGAVILKSDEFINPPTLPLCAAYMKYPKYQASDQSTRPEIDWKFAFKPKYLNTPLTFVAGMFCFYKGGLRFKTTCVQEKDGVLLDRTLTGAKLVYNRNYDGATMSTDNNSFDYVYPQSAKYISPVAYEQQPSKGFAEYQIPYYSPTLQSCAWNNVPYALFDRPLPWVELEVTKLETSKVRVHVATAASDDLDFGLFIGPPPVFDERRVRIPEKVYQSVNNPKFLITRRTFCLDRVANCDPCYEINGTFSQWPSVNLVAQQMQTDRYYTNNNQPITFKDNQWSDFQNYFSETSYQNIYDKNKIKNRELQFNDLTFNFIQPPFKFNVYNTDRSKYQIDLPFGSSKN